MNPTTTAPPRWTSGWARIAAAVQRSWWLIIVVTLGVANATVAYGVIAEPLYRATSLVLLVSVNEDEPNPERRAETQALLARSDAFHAVVARDLGDVDPKRLGRRVGVTLEPGADVVRFTAEGSTEQSAVQLANAVADAYPGFVASLGTQAARVVSRAPRATKVRPKPVRDGVLGTVLGLAIGLMFAAARETFYRKVRDVEDVEGDLGWPVVLELQLTRDAHHSAAARLAVIMTAKAHTANVPTVLLLKTGTANDALADSLAAALAQVHGSEGRAAIVDGDGRARLASADGASAPDPHGDIPVPQVLQSLAQARTRNGPGPRELTVVAAPVDGSALSDELAARAEWVVVMVVGGATTRRDLRTFARRSALWPVANRGVIFVRSS